jgi:hypothetical protein
VSAFAISSTPSTITYVDATGQRRIYSFATADCTIPIFGGCASPQDLVVNYWDGYAWHWADQGRPPSTFAVYNPAAITYLDAAGRQEIYAFAEASNGHLVVNYWDGYAWHWADQGLPPRTSWVVTPAVITYLDAAGRQEIYAFAEASNGHLVVNYWNGFSWNWADQGFPAGSTGVGCPDAITYLDAAGRQEIYVFACGLNGGQENGQLVVNYWNGFGWNWADMGFPPGKTGVYSNPTTITYVDTGGNRRIYSFVMSNDQHLVVLWWDGFNWNWADMGLPAGKTAVSWASAITYLDAAGRQEIYAFASANDGHLVVLYWNGFNWNWADQGHPAGWNYVSIPDAITYLDAAGRQELYAFAKASNGGDQGDLVVNYWNGFVWNWSDQGSFE